MEELMVLIVFQSCGTAESVWSLQQNVPWSTQQSKALVNSSEGEILCGDNKYE